MSHYLKSQSGRKLIIICVTIVAIILLGELTGLRARLSLAAVKGLFLQHQVLGILLFCLAFSLGNLLYIPGWVFLVAAVLALGKEWGGIATYTAALFSATTSYCLIYFIGRDVLRDIDNKVARRIFSRLDEYPILCVAALRLIFQTAPPLNYSLAMSRIKFSHYILGTLIGLPLPIFAYCYFFELIFKSVLERIN